MSNGPSGVLSEIGVGAMLTFQFVDSDESIVVVDYQGTSLLAPGAGDGSTFTVTMYEFDGVAEAKLSMSGAPGLLWASAPGAAGLEYPIVLAAEAGQFVLTDDGAGNITIANTVAPPDPYLGVVPEPVPYIASGFGGTLGQASLFNISVVG